MSYLPTRGLSYVAAGLLSIGGLAGAVVIWWRVEPDQGTAWFEAARALLGVALVTGLGLLVALAMTDREAGRERRRNDLRLLSDFHKDLVTAYNGVKEARRTMRAKGWLGLSGTFDERQVKEFEHWMACVCRVQLDFERLKRQAKAQRQLFGVKWKTVHDDLMRAEDYLNKKVVDDWERSDSIVRVGQTATLVALPGLVSFLGTDSAFKDGVTDRMDDVEAVLAELLLAAGSA